MDRALLETLFGVFGIKRPVVGVDLPTGAIVVGPFTLSRNEVTVKGLRGDRQASSYTLDVDTGGGDVLDLFTDTDFRKVAVRMVGEYAQWRATVTLDMLADTAQAEAWQKDQEELKAARAEGKAYWLATAPGARTKDANPYPYGIAHYQQWGAGYDEADAEAVF
jgi:hypothetical protein